MTGNNTDLLSSSTKSKSTRTRADLVRIEKERLRSLIDDPKLKFEPMNPIDQRVVRRVREAYAITNDDCLTALRELARTSDRTLVERYRKIERKREADTGRVEVEGINQQCVADDTGSPTKSVKSGVKSK